MVKKILIITKNFTQQQGGVKISIDNITKFLIDKGYHIDINLDNHIIEKNVKHIKKNHRFFFLRKYDLVLIFGAWSLKNFFYVFFAKILGIPIIFSPKGMLCKIEFQDGNKLFKSLHLIFIESLIVLMSQYVWLTSKNEYENIYFIQSLVRRSYFIAPEFISNNKILENRNRKSDKNINIGIIAKFSKRKELFKTLKVISRLKNIKNLNHSINVNIAGSPVNKYDREFKKIISYFSNLDINLIGDLNDKQKKVFFNKNEVIFANSMFESFGLVVIEGISYSCKVIVSKQIGCLEYLDKFKKYFLDIDEIFDLKDIMSIQNNLFSFNEEIINYHDHKLLTYLKKI